jgi:hypothetical protein
MLLLTINLFTTRVRSDPTTTTQDDRIEQQQQQQKKGEWGDLLPQNTGLEGDCRMEINLFCFCVLSLFLLEATDG